MTFASILIFLASLGILVAMVWMTVLAFKNEEKVFGILFLVSIVLPIGPFVALAFMVLKWSIAKKPAIVLLSSFALLMVALGAFFSAAKAQLASPEFAAALNAEAAKARAAQNPAPAAERAEPPPAPAETTPAPPPPPPAAKPDKSRRPPPPASTAASETATPPVAAPPVTPDESGVSPVEVTPLTLGEPNPNQIRTVRFRLANQGKAPVRELKLMLDYLDPRGRRIGGWTTIHSGNDPLAGASATNEFELQAFFVPQFTHEVRAKVESVRFTDDTRWPPRP